MEAEHDIRPATNSLVERMFIATADQDYILARWAAINRLDINFLWLGLQAVEKYLKAILLLNGRSAKKYRHNVERLYKAVRRLDSITFGPLTKPTPLFLDDIPWFDEPVLQFLKRLNLMGDPNNRYMLFGFAVESGDLFKFDQLVWAVRRHCRPFAETILAGEKRIKINWIERLKKNSGFWQLDNNFLIEKLVDGEASTRREALMELNVPFAPNRSHTLTGYRLTSARGPLDDWIERLKSKDAEVRRHANNILKWVVKNITLAPRDMEEIQKALGGPAPLICRFLTRVYQLVTLKDSR
jgi:hypothetical protein